MASKAAIVAALRNEIDSWKDNPPEAVEVPADFLRDVLKYLEGKRHGRVLGDTEKVSGVESA